MSGTRMLNQFITVIMVVIYLLQSAGCAVHKAKPLPPQFSGRAIMVTTTIEEPAQAAAAVVSMNKVLREKGYYVFPASMVPDLRRSGSHAKDEGPHGADAILIIDSKSPFRQVNYRLMDAGDHRVLWRTPLVAGRSGSGCCGGGGGDGALIILAAILLVYVFYKLFDPATYNADLSHLRKWERKHKAVLLKFPNGPYH